MEYRVVQTDTDVTSDGTVHEHSKGTDRKKAGDLKEEDVLDRHKGDSQEKTKTLGRISRRRARTVVHLGKDPTFTNRFSCFPSRKFQLVPRPKQNTDH